ncbi:MAG: nicotine adenine dinucleotide glycohydrolase [Treponema sp.]|nr:nicotine adenine dinucleotide glycohydrolase [Candidatus Treponema merdequi]
MRKIILSLFVLSVSGFIFAAPQAKSKWFKAQSNEAPIASASATSELVEAQFEGRYLYSPANMLDGDMSTTWCEAEKNGPGLNEVITFEFSEPFSFDEIQIVNGFNYKNLYEQNNRVKKILLTQVAKEHFQQKEYELLDNVPDWQSIKFKQLQTVQILTIKILDVYKGTNFDDTCLSDIRFLCKKKVIPFKGVEQLKAVQNENSRMLLTKDAKNFSKDFLSLFKLRNGSDNYGDLILIPEDNYYPYHLIKNNNKITYMERNRIFKTDDLENVKNYICSPAYIYDKEKGEHINIFENPEVLGNAKYIVMDSYYWDDYPKFELKDYKIIRKAYVDYVETETSTIIKFDGNNIFLNGVRYTILSPEDFIIVSTPE